MRNALSFAAALLVVTAIAYPGAPAEAQRRGERVLIIYGNDPCPTSNGEEIVVCARLDENERYRIPMELRESTDITGAGTWASRARSLEYVGASGTDSCSPVGAGGSTGCFREIVRRAREERRAEGESPAIEF